MLCASGRERSSCSREVVTLATWPLKCEQGWEGRKKGDEGVRGSSGSVRWFGVVSYFLLVIWAIRPLPLCLSNWQPNTKQAPVTRILCAILEYCCHSAGQVAQNGLTHAAQASLACGTAKNFGNSGASHCSASAQKPG